VAAVAKSGRSSVFSRCCGLQARHWIEFNLQSDATHGALRFLLQEGRRVRVASEGSVVQQQARINSSIFAMKSS